MDMRLMRRRRAPARGGSHPLSIAGTSVLTATDGVAYTGFTATASGGTTPYTYSLVGTWPTGITINSSTGEVSGTPTQVGTFASLSVRVTDNAASTADLDTFSLVVASALSTVAVSGLSTTPVEIDLTGYASVTISAHDALLSANTTDIFAQFGYNDGVTTTWYETSGNYVRNNERDTTSVVSNEIAILLLDGLNAAGYGALHYWEFTADCLALACPKPCRGTEFLSDPSAGSADGSMLAHLFAPVTVVNKMRIWISTGTGTSGSIHVLKETRSQTLIASTDVSAMGNTEDYDVSGYSSVYFIAPSIAINKNSTNGMQVAPSTDNGSSFDTTTSNFNRTYEKGSTGDAVDQLAMFQMDGNINTAKAFWGKVANLDVAVPSFSHGVEFTGTNTFKWFNIHRNAAVVDALRFYADATDATCVGSSGTLYVVGDATPTTIIDTIAVSTDMSDGLHDFSVAGYSRVNIVSYDAVAGAAACPFVYESADGGLTYDETLGDYWRKREKGSNESQGQDMGHALGSRFLTETSILFAAELFGVDKAMPTFSRSAEFSDGVKMQGIRLAADATDHLKLTLGTNLEVPSTVASGSSGTIYVTGQA